ncbi:MAG: transglycosylase SLT domain-containing protein [Sulfurimonas sp.]|nr:transglycosylase SLT domain-containing protein [Sulfurimonas sp.]MDQ7061492.1 transglycosylase SLT domain-containing protein [Sulfurimonas sp.]
MKYLLLLLFPFVIFANLRYESNHNKELAILESFDIEPSFLHDPLMNEIRNNRSNLNKNKHFFTAMDNAYIFIPAIKSLLNKNDIPQEFLYLAMAESNFKTKAYSKKKASGLWQFMPRTGKRYNLKINEYVDERRDLIKSTKAASEYLSSLHKRFGKWYLAAIAYNCGGGRLNHAIKKAGSDSLAVLLDSEKKYIPRESRNYIRKIVALALVGSDEQFMLKGEYEYLLNRANAYSVATINVPGGESLKRLASVLQMPIEDLQQLNRHLKYDFVPPYSNGYNIYIPYLKLAEFKQNYTQTQMKNIYKIHIVSSGDNLSYIGQKYGVAYKLIKDFNKLKNSKLRLKQKLIIPIDNSAKAKKISTNFYYMVKRGDSLESISRAKKVSIKNIKTYNHINGSLIKIGERLKLYE